MLRHWTAPSVPTLPWRPSLLEILVHMLSTHCATINPGGAPTIPFLVTHRTEARIPFNPARVPEAPAKALGNGKERAA